MAIKLTKARLMVLKQYGHTSDSQFMQQVAGATELYSPLGLLDWHGDQYGTHFYSINAAGREALARSQPTKEGE